MKQQIIKSALDHAAKLLGANYSKTYRLNFYSGGSFDRSSYTYACFSSAGYPLVNSSGGELITSYIQTGSQGFDVIYPKGGISAVQKSAPKGTLKSLNPQPGDIVFYCFDSKTTRKPPITHVAIVYDSSTIIHNANNTEKCCRKPIAYGDGNFNCLLRLKDNVMLPEKPTVKKGSRGKFVRMLQILLNVTDIKPKLTCDADFGSKTEAALIAYQKSAGLAADGICGETTWNKLFGNTEIDPPAAELIISRLLKQRMTGEDVWAVKKYLFINKWYNSNIGQITNKTFGADTLTALKNFQKAKGLTTDGIVGRKTITAMGGVFMG